MSDNSVLWTLLSANLLLVTWFVCRHCVSRAGIEINHVLTLSIGFMAYWLAPFLICMLRLFSDFGETKVGYAFFESIPASTRELYLTICFLTYSGFALGSELCRHQLRNAPRIYQPIRFPIVYLNVYLGLFTLIALITAYSIRQDFGNGYLTLTAEDASHRSVFTSATSNLLVLVFLYSLKREERLRVQMGDIAPTFGQVMRNRSAIVYAIAGLLLLSTGQRIIAMTSLVMFLVYSTVYFKRIRLFAAAMTVSSLSLMAGIIGIIRLHGNINIQVLVFQIFQEITGTSQTLFGFLKAGRLEWFNFPKYLLNSMINLTPRPLLPNKADYLISPVTDGYVVFAPLGSFHNFVQFCVNFGLLGTVLVWFGIGYGMQRLKQKGSTIMHRAAYILVTGFLMTTFYRDDFSLSIAKSLFQISLVLPLIIVGSVNWLLNYMHPMPPLVSQLPPAQENE